MKASILEVRARPLFECRTVSCWRIQSQIMKCEDLFQMRKVVFRRLHFQVAHQMAEGGDRPTIVESSTLVREHKKDHALFLQHTQPLLEGA